MEALGLGLIRQSDALSDQDRLRQAKQEVLGRMQVLRTTGGRTVIMESSGETYMLDRDRESLISSQGMRVNPQGQVVVQTAMRQRLDALRNAGTQLAHAEHIVAEAFREYDDKLCVPRQIAAVLNVPMAEVLQTFDDLIPDNWQL